MAGGRAGLAVAPKLLRHLGAGRRVALVSGTNGKTTSTRLLAAAVESELGEVATNATGSNMPAGHLGALVAARPGVAAVLEVDEGYVPAMTEDLDPEVVVLLNLSRDQLDRSAEVRMVAGRWRAALMRAARCTVVANADDPLVVWGASGSARPLWVGAGASWHADATGCPACEGTIVFDETGWACPCGFERPSPEVWLDGGQIVCRDGSRSDLRLRLPGAFNRANAVMAGAAAHALGVAWPRAIEAMGRVEHVAGRFGVVEIAGCSARLMLAKNPAGWEALLDLVGDPVVVAINARGADGRDPSWLWDVRFERLRGRVVVATGERCRDLSVRLRYADVPHITVEDPAAAVRAAAMRRGDGVAGAAGPAGAAGVVDVVGAVDVVGNYTAFRDLLGRARRA